MSEILGISGYAGCGKDLFFRLFKEEMKKINNKTVSRVAIADTLKYEVRSSMLELKGIDPTECSPEQKEEIRDFLIFYGLQRRSETLGRYWVEKISKIIKHHINSDFICVTDIRFNFYPHDEVYWLKNEMGGKLLVIKQFVYQPFKIGTAKPIKDYQLPPNAIEEKNMEQIEKDADYFIEWPFCFWKENKDHINENLRPAVKEFILKNYENKN